MTAQDSASWWGRNWKWVLPVGCLGIIAFFVILGVAILAVVTGVMKSSGAVQHAVEIAASDPEVLAVLGEPVETGWFTSGTINVSGPSGEADIAIPLRGSARSGRLYVVAEKTAGRWEFELLELEVDGRKERIDLLAEPDGSADELGGERP